MDWYLFMIFVNIFEYGMVCDVYVNLNVNSVILMMDILVNLDYYYYWIVFICDICKMWNIWFVYWLVWFWWFWWFWWRWVFSFVFRLKKVVWLCVFSYETCFLFFFMFCSSARPAQCFDVVCTTGCFYFFYFFIFFYVEQKMVSCLVLSTIIFLVPSQTVVFFFFLFFFLFF